MTTKGRRRWKKSQQLNQTKSEDSCKSKSEIDESRVSADGGSTDAGVQAEKYQGMTTGTAIDK